MLILHTVSFTAAMLPTQPIPLPIQRQIAAQQAAGLQQVHTQQIQVQQQQQQQQQQQLIDQQALQQQVLWCFIFILGSGYIEYNLYLDINAVLIQSFFIYSQLTWQLWE